MIKPNELPKYVAPKLSKEAEQAIDEIIKKSWSPKHRSAIILYSQLCKIANTCGIDSALFIELFIKAYSQYWSIRYCSEDFDSISTSLPRYVLKPI